MTKYEEYAQLQKQIDELELKKESLREDISKILPEEGFKDETITVFWIPKKKWKYSPKVDEMSSELKKLKEKEEKEGVATSEETKQLTIKVK